MDIQIASSAKELGKMAASQGAAHINKAIDSRGSAAIILATGASQFETIAALLKHDVDWQKVTCFHLDEYIGLPITHPASFRKYLCERFANHAKPHAFHLIDGEAEPETECKRLGKLIAGFPIDVAFIGIGENAHLAFNDPPADFETMEAYLPVELDDACRAQQFKEGWFDSIEAVPRRAISMSVNQVLKSDHIVCSVPDKRKANAVRATVEGPITPQVPASILQRHDKTTMFLDEAAAELLGR
jgi:glucosamine-6-phosphate deaminase